MSRRAPCPTCPRLAGCLERHDDACAELRDWRANDPARELADQWAAALPGEPGEQACG